MEAAFHGDTETWRRHNRALRDTMVDHARDRVPFYRQAIKPAAPFHEIPISTKVTVRKHYQQLVAEETPLARRFPDKTSGSTAVPMAFLRDTSQGPAENISSDRFFRRLWGIPDAAVNVSLTSRDLPRNWRRRWVDDGTVGRLGGGFPPRPVIPVPIARLEQRRLRHELRSWNRYDPYLLTGFSSILDTLASDIEREGLSLPRRPVAVIAYSETLTQAAFEKIARVFGAPVYGRYSSNEFSRMAGTLAGTRRYIFNPLMYHVEIADQDGNPAGPGETGRIIVTDLNNYVMPFIRYDTGDLALASEEGYVGGFLLVDEVTGRAADVLRMPSGKMIGASALQTALVRRENLQPHIRTYQCAQTGPNELELRVVWDGPPTEELRRRAAGSLRLAGDPDTVVRVKDVDELQKLPSGKAWIVRREID